MTRWIRLGGLIAVALLIAAPVGGQYPGQYIPPTRVPQTDEPELAKPNKASDLPEKAKQSLIGNAPASGSAVTPVTPAAPVSVDPPTPVVSIHVVAPASISAEADIEYKIIVENKSQAEAHHVRVSFPKPLGVQIVRFEPENVGGSESTTTIVWDLRTLKPGETRKDIRVVLRPSADKPEAVEVTARVQFEHGQKVRTVLHRPQLTIQKVSNRHALENQPISCKIIVKNTGAVAVNKIVIHEHLKEGLTYNDPANPNGLKKWDIDTLAPNQTREFLYKVVGTRPGELSSEVEARAERGVYVKEGWKINVGPSPLTVKLTGPTKVYLDHPARYDIEVEYSGSAPLDNVVVAFGFQKGMKIVRSSQGSKSFENRLQWAVPRLGTKEKQTFSVWAQASSPGTVPTFAEVLWHGPKQFAEWKTEFLGAAALHVDVRESNDPVRKGDKVRYVMTVTNRGTAAATDVKLLVRYPLTQFGIDNDGSDGSASTTMQGVQEIGPLTIPPKGTVTKTITLKATTPGKAIIHVEMESREHLTSGNVTREEPTTITD